jgi:hypothetical protein
MADEKKPLTHTVHGSVPADEWDRFIKANFKPGKETARAARSPTMGGVCGGLGCPSTHPISGTVLTGCTISVEHDGSTTIHCHYAPIEARL